MTTSDGTLTPVVALTPVEVPDAPGILGLRFRRWGGPDDIPAMATISNAVRDAVGVFETADAASMLNEWEHPSHWSPPEDSVLAEVDGEVIAYGLSSWEEVNGGGRSYEWFFRIRPDWWRRGITTAVIPTLESRLREVAAGHGDIGPRWFGCWHWEGDRELAEAVPTAGYTPVRRFFDMVRPTLDDLPEVELPDGIEVRPVERDQLRAIFDADNEAFLDHWGGIDRSDEAFTNWIGDPDFDPSLWQVAWDGDQIAALVVNVIHPAENERNGTKRFWLDDVATRRPWRRRGLARALMVRSMRDLRDRRGMTSAALGVDTENPNQALHLYTDLGFEAATSAVAYRKPFDQA